MKSRNHPFLHPFLHPSALAAATLVLAASSACAQTLLLSDNLDTGVNNQAGTFNANIATSQGGTLAGTAGAQYDVVGSDWRAQHGAFNMTISNAPAFYGTADVANVSVVNDFATQANAANQPLQISFNLVDVTNINADNTAWVQFNVGNSAHAGIQGAAVGLGMLFRADQRTQTFSGGSSIEEGTYADGDLVTITLSGTGGVGSAFNGNGSVATVKVGSGAALTYTLAQQTNANVTFGGFEPNSGQVVGNFDNLSVSLVSGAASDYDTWAGPFGFNLSGGPAADDDNDGLSNHEEYAFGLIPTSGASVNPIAVQLDKSTKKFSYTRRKPSLGTSLTYSVWFSENLAGWTQDTPANVVVTPIPSSDNETVEVTLSTLPGNPLPAKLFIQVRAN